MRAIVLLGPGRADVRDVEAPEPAPGDVVVDVRRVGLCGTDRELFTGEMAYFQSGRTSYPVRPGHEWVGVVRAIGAGVDESLLGQRVTGTTMLGCGRCDRCAAGRRHLCPSLVEVGISNGFSGALAEQLRVPASSLVALPDTVDDQAGALAEPGGNSWRAVDAAEAGPGRRILIWGGGSIGLLALGFAAAAGAEVHLVVRRSGRDDLARQFGVTQVWTTDALPALAFDSVIDATNDPDVPRAALGLVEPGGRVVYIGLAGTASPIDTRDLVLREITAVGILGGSDGLVPVVEIYASGRVDPRPLVGMTVGLEAVPEVLADGLRGTSTAPKVHVDPRL